MNVAGRTVAITGGTGSLGQSLTRRLLGAGADVLVLGRSEPMGLPVQFFRADFSSDAEIDAAAAALQRASPDILINLAGVQYVGPFEAQSASNIYRSYRINLIAPVRLSQAVLPLMYRRGTGQIVNVGSVLGSINYPYFVTYSSSKAGLRGFSEGLRRELRGSGIHVTHIAPRAVRGGMTQGLVERFAHAAGMSLDDPERIVSAMLDAIVKDKTDVVIGWPESLFVKVNALVPRLVDGPIAVAVDKARPVLGQ